jgi:hypothetical protein
MNRVTLDTTNKFRFGVTRVAMFHFYELYFRSLDMFGGLVGGLVGSVVGNLVSSLAGSLMNNVMGSSLSDIISEFGEGNIAGALANSFLKGFADGLKELINNSDMPQFMKDAANEAIDNMINGMKQETSSCAEDAVEESGMADAMEQAGYSCAQQSAEEAEEGGENANWLVALAGSLAQVQHKFLDAALQNMKTMDNNAGVDGQEQTFLKAQSEYQANMQMFNMVANMTANSLKSLGEGLTAIARKQ